MRAFGWTLAFFVAACATHAAQTPASTANPAARANESAVPSLVSPEDLAGVWVEYWAVSGHADTQRYAFFSDGRFGWRASESDGGPLSRRWGRFAIVPRANETPLVLSVLGHEERFGCEGVATRRVLHDPPLDDRLVLGECPPNEEARALDPSYRCLGISGRAFWRQAASPEDESEFIPSP